MIPKLQALAEIHQGTPPASFDFGLPRQLARYANTYGPHVSKIATILEALAQSPTAKTDRTALIQQLAELVGVSYRQANRFTTWVGVHTPSTPFTVNRYQGTVRLVEQTITMRKACLDVIAGYSAAADAALASGFTPEAVRARVNKYLAPHQLGLKDLKEMRVPAREALAKVIEALPVKEIPQRDLVLRRKRTA